MNIKCAHTELVPLHKLVENPKNPNKHPQNQIDILAKIIDFQGQRSPIVVSKNSGFITKGHGRLMAIQKLGWAQAAVDYQDYESEAQELADMIADNKISELANSDDLMIQELAKDLGDFDFELLGLDDLSFLTANDIQYEQDSQVIADSKFKLEVMFKNDMDMNDVKDDLLHRGYIVRVL
jgi:ParB-like nuclease domain